MESDLKVQLSRPNCAYCKAPVEIGETKRACEACMSWSHLECVELHGGCPACGAGLPAPSASSQGQGAALKGLPGPEVAPETVQPAPAVTQAPPVTLPRTKPVDLLLLGVLGLAGFALSMVVLGLLIGFVGKLLGAFTTPASDGAIVAFAAMGSMITTPLFTIYVAAWIREWRVTQFVMREAEEAKAGDRGNL